MSDENMAAIEFLSKCWVPHIASKHRVYYACGNTRMRDFLRDFKVSREMDILVLGLGDVRHVMKTVAGLSQRPPSSAGQVKEIHFHLNDDDQDVIARDIILLEILSKLDPESKSDAEFLWSVWYNAFVVKKDFTRLKAILEDLIDKYSNSGRVRERICNFGDKQSLKSVLKTWNSWLNRKLSQPAIKQRRLQSFGDGGYTMSFHDINITQYASMQVHIDRGIKESDVKVVGKEMLTAARDGFVNFSEERKGRKDFVNSTLMRPGCDDWCVEDGAHAAASYLPLQQELFKEHPTIHGACFGKMRETIYSYLQSWKMTKVTYTFWATDLFHLCHWLLPSDAKFDFIFTSNLMDHVGLVNLLLITQPRLKTSQSMLLTESQNWNQGHESLEEFFNDELRCKYMLLPSMIGLKLAEDLNLGTSDLQGFYRTMYGRHSDLESIYWTKSLNQQNVQIDLEGSPEVREALRLLLLSTFWNKQSDNAASSVRQTPLTLMYCFQRLQHLIRGGMTTLSEFVELAMGDRSMNYSRNRISWDIVCWAFGLKHEQDQLCIVKIPFKDVNSWLVAMNKACTFNCRLRLDYNNSSNKREVLSLFQYDAIGEHFQVPILESAWKALPEDATLSVFVSDNEKSPSVLPELIKRVGKVIATFSQPKQADTPAHDSAQFITCYEDVEKYRLPKAFRAETKTSFELLCQQIVSSSKNNIGVKSSEEVEVPYTFSCAVDSYEITNVNENQMEAILYKQKTFNTGRTALPFRLIDDSELVPFTSGRDIRMYLTETMICDLMFCSPPDIESRGKAFRGQDLLADDAFLVLRVVVEQLWQLGSQKDKALQHILRLEIQGPKETSEVLILEIEGYYMYDGLPLVKMRFTELNNNSSALNTSKETTTIYVKDRICFELLKKMLFTNSLRMCQEEPASVKMIIPSSQSLNTFLQMVFRNEDGEDMALALQKYPSNTGLVKNYIEKVYSASIRQNYVAPKKASTLFQKQTMEWLSSFSTKTPRSPSGEQKSDSAMTKNSSGLPLKKQASCSECKKLTTDLKKCIRCKSVAYCSKECQVKDWPKHKKNCSSTLLKVDDGPAMKKTNESDSPTKPKNISGASIKKSKIKDCVPNESGIKDVASTKKIENDPLTKDKIEDCPSFRSNSNASSIERQESKDNSAEDSPVNRNAECCISKAMYDVGGASAKTQDGDHSSTMETNDDGPYLQSVVEDGTKADDSSMQANCQTSHSAKTKNEVGSSIKAENPSQSHLAEIQSKDLYDATADNSLGPRSGELCTLCRLENSNMKKCTKCKSAVYCSRECQRADWKRHRSECQTQQLPSTVPLMSRCNSCGVLGTEMKKCSQCKSACYCSPECQRKDWKNHKPTCRRP